MASTAEEALATSLVVRPHVIVVGASLALAMGERPRTSVLSDTPVIALSQGDDVPIADAVLATPVDALELLATVRMLAAGLVHLP